MTEALKTKLDWLCCPRCGGKTRTQVRAHTVLVDFPLPEMKIVSAHILTKSNSNALTSEAFTTFIQEHGITEFYIAGADAAACIKSTCFNMTKNGYTVHVLSDCITSYDKKKLPEMLTYYEGKGCSIMTLPEGKRSGHLTTAMSFKNRKRYRLGK